MPQRAVADKKVGSPSLTAHCCAHKNFSFLFFTEDEQLPDILSPQFNEAKVTRKKARKRKSRKKVVDTGASPDRHTGNYRLTRKIVFTWQVPPLRHGWCEHSFEILLSQFFPVYPGGQEQV